MKEISGGSGVSFFWLKDLDMAFALLSVVEGALSQLVTGNQATVTTPSEQVGSFQGKPVKVSLTVTVG